MVSKNELVISPLRVLKLKNADTVWWGMRRRPPEEMKKIDIVVLHPDLPEMLRGRRENRTLVGLHANLAEINYICAIAMLTDEQIEGVTDVDYTVEQVQEWLSEGYNLLPCLPGAEQAFAFTQLSLALGNNLQRIIKAV